MSKERIWHKVRAKLKKRFLAAGITRCELRWGGCKDTSFLSFAHRQRRWTMPSWKKDPEAHKAELEWVVLACQECHKHLDELPKDETWGIVTEIRSIWVI